MSSAPDKADLFTLREACADDATAIQTIYANHVLTGLSSFEEVPPDTAEVALRMQRALGPGATAPPDQSGGKQD